MTNTKRKAGKILAVLLIAILVCVGTSIIAMINGALTAYASTYDIDKISYDKHIATMEDDFAGDSVIVTLKPGYSDINKSVSMHSFKTTSIITAQCPGAESISRQSSESLSADFANKSESIDLTENSDKIINRSVIESITDLTQMKNPSKIVKKDSFVQILSIQLRENSKEGVLRTIEELEQLDMVLSAEPNYYFETENLWQPPNDIGFTNQWGLGAAPGIRSQQAWTMTNGTTIPNRIRVGIFEEGLQANHPDLRVIQGSFTPGENADRNHGTHVAGIIGAITHNNQGVAGIAQVDIALLDKGPAGAAQRPQFVDSLVWAIDNDIRIANASFRFLLNGTNAPWTQAHREAIRVFGENGGLLVCAAGNEQNNNDAASSFPAGYGDARNFPEITNVITVGSIDSNGGFSSFSNWGNNSVHIYAPGGNILSTVPTGNTAAGYRRHSDGYAYTDGTSMAAPPCRRRCRINAFG